MSELDDSACQRWAQISDRRLVDDAVSEQDARFLEEHRASCPLCAAEAEAWSEIAASEAEPELAEPVASDLVARALALAGGEGPGDGRPQDKKLPLRSDERPAVGPSYAPHAGSPVTSLDDARRSRTAYLAGAGAAVLALAAGFALLMRGRAEAPIGPTATLVSAHGDVRLMDTPVSAGATFGAGARLTVGAGGSACFTFDDGRVKSCLDASGELMLASAAPQARHLVLVRGTVVNALEKLPSGHSFEVSALDASAAVTGTVFSVTRNEQARSVVVRVHEGSVRAKAPGHDERSVTEGQQLDPHLGASSPVPPATRAHELELLGISLPRGGSELAVAPTPTGQAAPESSAAPPPSASADVGAKLATAAEMLQAARALRAAGNAAGAAEAYRRLMGAHPRSAEARAALVSLAELQLGPLGDPSGALRSYDAYLRSGGGALTQEARYGRIQALRRLGRTAEEHAAIQEFVTAYPSSVQARALKARLGEGSADAAAP